jgi:hypothetical protein
MRTFSWKTTFVAGCLVAAAFAGLATPLQRTDIPANPNWLAHVDFDRLRPTAIGQHILSEMNKPEAQARLAAFQTIVSFDLRTQLHGATAYSAGTAPEDAVALVYADFNADRLVILAKAAHDSQHNTYKEHIIYNWIDDNKKAKKGVKPRVYAAIDGKRVVFGQREARVAQALDVLDGATVNLASANRFSDLGGSGDASFLEAAAVRFDLPEGDPNAAVLRLSKQGRLQVAETQGQINGTLNLEAKSEEVAGNMASIAQGLISLVKLQQDNPEAVKLAQGLTLKRDGAHVVATLSVPAADVIEMIKADAARKAQKKAEKTKAK